MAVIISSKNKEKTFTDKEIINIGSNSSCDFVIDIGTDFMLTIQLNQYQNKCMIVNNFQNENILFKGQPIGAMLEFENVCKLMI